jgi:hypothetical protein
LELTDAELVKDEKQRVEALKQIAAILHISEDKLNKDLELYRSNLDKIEQAMITMADMLLAIARNGNSVCKLKRLELLQQVLMGESNDPDPSQDKASSGS